jgi:hypothetical protein
MADRRSLKLRAYLSLSSGSSIRGSASYLFGSGHVAFTPPLPDDAHDFPSESL